MMRFRCARGPRGRHPQRVSSAPRRPLPAISAVWPVLLLFGLLAGAHCVRVPLFEGPDEPDNLLMVRYVAEEGRLPTPSAEPTEELELLARGLLPPAWFVLTAPLLVATGATGADGWQATPTLNPRFLRGRAEPGTLEQVLADPQGRLQFRHGTDERRPFAGAALDVRTLRATTVLWGALAVLAVFLCARRVEFRLRSPSRAVWAAGLAATTPQLAHLAGTVTMDLALAAFGGLSLWCAILWCDPREGERAGPSAFLPAFGAGAFAGLAALTKLNGLVLFATLPLAAWLGWREGRRFLRPLAAAALGVLLVAGPYYLWAWAESGHPLWMWQYQKVSPYHNPPGQPEGLGLTTLAQWGGFLGILFLTWFADFGWTAVWFPAWIVVPAALCLGAGAFACLWWLARLRGERAWRDGRSVATPLVFLVLSGAGMLAAEVFFNLRFPQPHGRHLYPFLPAFVVPVAFGLERLRLLRFTVLVQGALSVLALVWLVGALRPAGWNADPGWSVTDAERRADPLLVPPAEGGVRWLAPEQGAASGPAEPPVLVWETRPGARYDVALVIGDARFRSVPWRADGVVFRARWHGLELTGEFPLPASFWAGIPAGESLYVQVIELGEDGAAAERSTVLELVRAP